MIPTGVALLVAWLGAPSLLAQVVTPAAPPAAVPPPASPLDDGYDPVGRGVNVLHYDLRIELPVDGRVVTGRAGILFEATIPGLERLRLDLASMAVDSVAVDGRPARFAHAAPVLEIDLPAPLERGARAEAVVWYHGEPADGLLIGPNRHGHRTVFADNWADRARHWFPGVDHPSDKASVDFRVEAPVEWEVVANGALREVRDLGDGRELTRWVETAEIPTYCMVIGAADFAITRLLSIPGVPHEVWAFPEDSVAVVRAFARAPEVLAFFDSLLGPFPYEKLAHVQSRTEFGGMENASAIFYGEDVIASAETTPRTCAACASENAEVGLIAHEMAHQWFGDAVTEAEWHHLWLSEGFAEYMGPVFQEFHGGPLGRGAEALQTFMTDAAQKATAYVDSTGQAIYDPATSDLKALLNPNNYEKAAWVLHMLRDQVGDEAFFHGLRDYYATFRDGVAWTADFQRVMEEASGLELGWFFEQWIGRPGHPVLQATTEALDAGRGRVTLRQVQPGEPFRFPLEIELGWRTGTRRERVVVHEREESWTFEVPDPLETVVVDPDGWLLHELSDGSA